MERFNREFVEERRKQEEENTDVLDFTGFDFPDEVTFKKELSNVYFVKAIFRKDVNFPSVTIEKPFVFNGEALFAGATFEGEARFTGAIFEDISAFVDCIFKEEARFTGVIFKEYTAFYRATFEGNVWFTGATFEDAVAFGGATFQRDTWFDHVIFKRDVWFDGITFKGHADFTMLSVSSDVLFDKITIEQIFMLHISKWEQGINKDNFTVDFRVPMIGEYGKIIITHSLGTTNGFIAGISLLDTQMDKIDFIDVDWPRPFNRKTIIDEVFLTREIENNIKPPHILSPERVAQTYRRLRKNYEDARRYSEAGEFLIGEMEVTRKYTQDTDGTNIKRSYMDSTWILHSLYFLLGKYGESVERPLIWLSSIWIIVSELHFFYIYKPQEYSHFIWCLLKSSYITLSAMFPFTSVTGHFDFFMKLTGSLLIGLIFIALRRKLERK